MIGYEFEHTFDNNWTVRQNLRYASVSLKEDALYANGWSLTDPTKLARYRFAHDTDVGIFTVDNQLEGEFATAHSIITFFLGWTTGTTLSTKRRPSDSATWISIH